MAQRAHAKKRSDRKIARRGSRSRPGGTSRRKSSVTARRRGTRRWSQKVTDGSNALTLKEGVFTQRDPKKIAASLKRSAEHSRRHKSSPFRSAMSMLTFFINRGGKGLPATRKRTLTRAKDELRKQFGRA